MHKPQFPIIGYQNKVRLAKPFVRKKRYANTRLGVAHHSFSRIPAKQTCIGNIPIIRGLQK